MNNNITIFYSAFFALWGSVLPHNGGKIQTEIYSQARQTAIKDFSMTKLFKQDSVFTISFRDSIHRMVFTKVDERHYNWVRGRAYPAIIAFDIIGSATKYLLDTTERIDVQNKAIPSGLFEKDGKVFLWWDNYRPLTDSTLKILDKFHLIKRGSRNDIDRFGDFISDDSKRGGQYYFCRNNLSVYKRVITNTAIGFYDPPDVICK